MLSKNTSKFTFFTTADPEFEVESVGTNQIFSLQFSINQHFIKNRFFMEKITKCEKIYFFYNQAKYWLINNLFEYNNCMQKFQF